MNRNMRMWLVLALLVVVALFSIFWTITNFPHPPFGERSPFGPIPGDIELYYTVTTVVSTINVTLLLILLITYFDMYTKTKSEFMI